MEHSDWDERKAGHVLELGMETRMSLQKFNYDWWQGNCERREDSWWFRGCFKIVVIHQPVPEIGSADVSNTEIPMWHHMAIHVKRGNGRMRYFDWEGNDGNLRMVPDKNVQRSVDMVANLSVD